MAVFLHFPSLALILLILFALITGILVCIIIGVSIGVYQFRINGNNYNFMIFTFLPQKIHDVKFEFVLPLFHGKILQFIGYTPVTTIHYEWDFKFG